MSRTRMKRLTRIYANSAWTQTRSIYRHWWKKPQGECMSVEVTEGANGSEDRSDAYQEAAVELAKGIALGAVPFLGQAIDAYDTIESSIVLYNA
ncbi:Uncharacterized protein ALO46_05038, partial [Pseudomonas syringae pv. solidagae]